MLTIAATVIRHIQSTDITSKITIVITASRYETFAVKTTCLSGFAMKHTPAATIASAIITKQMIGLRMRYHSKELIRMNQIQIYSLSEHNKIKHHTDSHDEIECEEKIYARRKMQNI
ncbi:Hypothetical predicted protein [Octopus vulgaris]|uniref:Uncharacterized protein n=1 Tax=Octopus vulgaris TaxID=6645 RepID=A0AA36F0U3_OCTVU|nr:Hypothetical predicted protein [Octopus vulgaris]